MAFEEDSLRERYRKLNVAKASPRRCVLVCVIRPIDRASPNLHESVAIQSDCESDHVLGLGRDCLTFEMLLVDIGMSDIELIRDVGVAKLRLACSNMVDLYSDRT